MKAYCKDTKTGSCYRYMCSIIGTTLINPFMACPIIHTTKSLPTRYNKISKKDYLKWCIKKKLTN